MTPFLSARHAPPSPEADALIAGFPSDDDVSFRSGASQGPGGIRTFSDSIESYSPRTRTDLEDLDLVDVGDVVDVEAFLDAAWPDGPGPLVASLGGDHAVTPPLVRSIAARSPGLVVVGFDAHLDLRATYPGEHACTFRRIADAGIGCLVAGVRSGSREEWADAPRLLRHHSNELDIPDALLDQQVYLTIDVDVLDPSVAPGVGNPEAGGPSFAQLLEALEGLDAVNVVAFDIVEVCPPLDPSGITQAAAATLARELILRFS